MTTLCKSPGSSVPELDMLCPARERWYLWLTSHRRTGTHADPCRVHVARSSGRPFDLLRRVVITRPDHCTQPHRSSLIPSTRSKDHPQESLRCRESILVVAGRSRRIKTSQAWYDNGLVGAEVQHTTAEYQFMLIVVILQYFQFFFH